MKEQLLIISVVLAAVILAVFWQVNGYDFAFDDEVYVIRNYHIQSGITLESMGWAFRTRYADLWNPVLWLSFMVDYQMFDLHAGGYHMTNLVLHILSALLLFWLFHRMTGSVWKSAFVAAFFGFHPLHVESVAWISERKDVLSAFFWMVTLCFYVYFTEKPCPGRYLPVLFSFMLALMTKPMVVTLPAVMLLLDYWPLKRFALKKSHNLFWQVKEKTPLFALSILFVFITLYNPSAQQTYMKKFPLALRFENAAISFIAYLEKTFWPRDLAAFYPFPSQIPLWHVICAALLMAVMTAFVFSTGKRRPFLLVGWLWYAITIVPVIGIMQISHYPYAMADRYHYLPSIGIAVMLAWGIPLLVKNGHNRKLFLYPPATIFIMMMIFLSWHQCKHWANNMHLWKHALQVTENNYVAHNNLGLALFAQGNSNQAVNHYNQSLQIAPDYVYAYNNRGIVNGQHHQYHLAIEDFNSALRIMPTLANAYNNRGYTYAALGQNKRAMDDYNKAIDLKPDYAEAYSNRGVAFFKQGETANGCFDAQKACTLGHCATLVSAKSIGLCR